MHQLLIGGNGERLIQMDAAMANRHGIISGATGSGKTVTLQILAEGFSQIGVPVFLADIKGDLSGLVTAGSPHAKLEQRIEQLSLNDFQYHGNPAVFWDVYAQTGHPVRTTVSAMGPLLLSHLLQLNDTQSGLMYSCFKIADDNGMLLLDLKDLRALFSWMGDNAKSLKNDYGNISAASIGAIQRRLLVLEQQGIEFFWGEPAIALDDLCKIDFSGNGVISMLDATKLTQSSPQLYASFLLWLLAEIYESFPEVGDTDKPKLVLFFDEAHLLFDNAPKQLIDRIEQTVRLIRSKGVGVFFISQNPLDIPDEVLGQLGLKIQHALRAYTPKDKKTIHSIAETFRPNPALEIEQVITELKIGEALVSTLDREGTPQPVERTLIRPPSSQIGPISAQQRQAFISRSPFSGKYEQVIDRHSAYEILQQRAEQQAMQQPAKAVRSSRASNRGQSIGEAMLKSAARSIGSQLGRQIIRGVLGSLLGGRR